MEIIKYENRKQWLDLRLNDVTSTQSSALFDANPYLTQFELYHMKADNIRDDDYDNEPMKWGRRLQDPIAEGIATDFDLHIKKKEEYIRLPELRMGSSFDYEFENGEIKGLLEIKNVGSMAFQKGWIVDGDDIQAPPYFEIQIQHQMAVSGMEYCYLGALIGGNKVILLKRKRDDKIISSLKKKIAAFWESVDQGHPPQPDFARDAAFISRLYDYAKPGKILKDDNKEYELLVKNYQEAAGQERDAKFRKDMYKAQILMKMKDVEKVKGEKYSITASVVPAKEIKYTRDSYRNFRIYTKKEKNDAGEQQSNR